MRSSMNIVYEVKKKKHYSTKKKKVTYIRKCGELRANHEEMKRKSYGRGQIEGERLSEARSPNCLIWILRAGALFEVRSELTCSL